jgi:IPT/TIG domain
VQVSLAPRFSSLADRFELSGSGFCGDADANSVRLAGTPALVLASSPASLIALPPGDLPSGNTSVQVTCGNAAAPPFSMTFLDLSLEADGSPLGPGERRALTVRIRGTDAKVSLEAHNLAPNVAELAGGNTTTVSSQGGAENIARFEVAGHERGKFNISIRLLPDLTPPVR